MNKEMFVRKITLRYWYKLCHGTYISYVTKGDLFPLCFKTSVKSTSSGSSHLIKQYLP